VKIGIIGTGNMGSGVAGTWPALGTTSSSGLATKRRGHPWARTSALPEAVIGKRPPTATS
jgi:predicted dinucleotide-binding enzyme